MPPSSTMSMFWRGNRAMLPFVLVMAPFGTLFGVAATEAGLDLFPTMAMSISVIAGASQFTALQLMADQTPTLVVILTSLAVNLRMAMYSAAITPHLGQAPLGMRACAAYLLTDHSFAISMSGFERIPMTAREKVAYFFGAAIISAPLWFASTLFGTVIGAALPPWVPIDFAMPITFLTILAPMVRTLPHLAAAASSVVAVLALAWVPYGGGVLIAAALAMMVGAEVERRGFGKP